jgi:hypothetical protein
MNARLVLLALLSLFILAEPLRAQNKVQSDSQSVKESNLRPRSISAIRLDVRAALIAEAESRRAGDNTAEVLRLVDLYHELAVHPLRDTSLVVRQLGQQLRSRLETVRDHIRRHISAAKAHEKKQDIPLVLVSPAKTVLAQQIAPPGGAAGQGAGALAPRPSATGTTDYGPELVEIIEQTISPATWNVNGGNGAVVYFAPLRVLVISAPESVHEQVGPVVGQLRANP